MVFKPLELMEKKYEINKKDHISRGDSGKIYLLGEGKIAKVPYNPFNGELCNGRMAQFALYQEYKKQELGRQLGINYPPVEGIFAIKETESGSYYPGLTMVNIENGETFDGLSDEVLKEARRIRDIEIEKARKLGFQITDNHKRNALWVNGEVYLIDAADVRIK